MTNFQVAAVFSDHCVLQRDKLITVFGYGPVGTEIYAELKDSKGTVLSSNKVISVSEKWEIQLEKQKAQNNCSLKVTASKAGTDLCFEKTFSDIAIGEVWLAGGQSNMEFELGNCTEGPDALKEPDPNVRFYYTNKIGWMDEKFYEAEKNTSWQTWDSEWKRSWSAVGFFFAKKLAADTGVTVGVIGCNWGGTSASAWMSKEALEVDSELKTYLDEQEEATKGKTIEQQCAEYDEYTVKDAEWQKKSGELYAKNPEIEWDEVQKILGPCLWPGPRSCKNPYRPSGLYECMLKRIIPYTMKGVLWYQGESDDHKPAMYYKLFSRMIQNWRDDWRDSSLPFVFVQLTVNRYKQDKDFKHWCFIREAQQKVNNEIKNAFMTCSMDLGQYNDIHPKAKKQLGERMENIALAQVYGIGDVEKVTAPQFKDALIKEDKILITFDNAKDGFDIREKEVELNNYKALEERQGTPLPEDFTGFEIAGADGVYYPAEFALGGSNDTLNTICLFSKKVPNPVFARYAWYNYGPVTVYGKNGLPLAPFRTRTDDSKTATEHAEIQQIMTV